MKLSFHEYNIDELCTRPRLRLVSFSSLPSPDEDRGRLFEWTKEWSYWVVEKRQGIESTETLNQRIGSKRLCLGIRSSLGAEPKISFLQKIAGIVWFVDTGIVSSWDI